jgi:hypothetical protein
MAAAVLAGVPIATLGVLASLLLALLCRWHVPVRRLDREFDARGAAAADSFGATRFSTVPMCGFGPPAGLAGGIVAEDGAGVGAGLGSARDYRRTMPGTRTTRGHRS